MAAPTGIPPVTIRSEGGSSDKLSYEAVKIVNRLLEADENFPAGFTATHPDGDQVEFRFEPAIPNVRPPSYRFYKSWNDRWTQKRESGNFGHNDVRDPATATQFLEQKMRQYEEAGWTVQPLQ